MPFPKQFSFEDMNDIYEAMKSSKWESLVDDVVRAAVRYSQIRVE